ncbi:MAG: TIGR03087 family PEP-CTERM/XrtA system glycosyltransferase [Gammaproteobacteria bacterium]|nr:TIGR03087 family PEP-CTERM/XrtA system glycosyltransferase [Gammaproteobacteria bacterium]MDH3768806.1 TIGR03087 family PEP-CTERM/XrtA system glycosyltransferase [Gammaproteobacteria bacterium]
MSDVLLLTHRIPWPPNKGDKIRSYHIFRHLAEQYRLHLGTFIDSADDWRHLPELEKRCESICVRPAGYLRTVLRGLQAIATGRSVTMSYYGDRKLSRWVSDLNQRCRVGSVLVFSTGMAPYVAALPQSARTVLDMVDVDSEKWREYTRLNVWPRSWLYDREARLLSEAETAQISNFDYTLLISEDEAELLRKRSGNQSQKIQVMPNGVDSDYFSTRAEYSNPYSNDTTVIVFTGAMDYWANMEGVTWFARSVLPMIRKQVAKAQFFIVGSNPGSDVRALAELPGVVVTGRVPDVRPYLAHAHITVAPLRVARGLQNKVLEAMAMDKPVVATSAAMRGIDYRGPGIGIADTPEQFADLVLRQLTATVVLANRDHVVDHFSWHAALTHLDRVLAGEKDTAEVARV